jgi:hypothetical protein
MNHNGPNSGQRSPRKQMLDLPHRPATHRLIRRGKVMVPAKRGMDGPDPDITPVKLPLELGYRPYGSLMVTATPCEKIETRPLGEIQFA